jgi:hypothetical protein
MPPELDTPADAPVRLVIVTGSGRSGTSTVAGTLKKLGLYVPQPEVEANDSNPRGFFEPRWAVDFHKRVLADAGVRTLDGRPEAAELMTKVAAGGELSEELQDWFAGQLQGPQIVVKDPRAFWLRDVWAKVAANLGVRTEWLTMLRHPAEVVGSRDMHYLKDADALRRRYRETANIAGWVNVALTNERFSRGSQRVFTHYPDLIADWRSTMTEVARRLELRYDYDLGRREHHEVDDFIDVSLRRAQLTWDDIDVPVNLREIAETVWQALDQLSRDPEDPAAMETLDAMRREYDQLYTHAVAVAQDHINSLVDATRVQVRRRVTRELRERQASVAPARSLPDRVLGRIRGGRQGR